MFSAAGAVGGAPPVSLDGGGGEFLRSITTKHCTFQGHAVVIESSTDVANGGTAARLGRPLYVPRKEPKNAVGGGGGSTRRGGGPRARTGRHDSDGE